MKPFSEGDWIPRERQIFDEQNVHRPHRDFCPFLSPENPIKMDDLGVPLFLETPIYIYILYMLQGVWNIYTYIWLQFKLNTGFSRVCSSLVR